jgi:hypothetical protein
MPKLYTYVIKGKDTAFTEHDNVLSFNNEYMQQKHYFCMGKK